MGLKKQYTLLKLQKSISHGQGEEAYVHPSPPPMTYVPWFTPLCLCLKPQSCSLNSCFQGLGPERAQNESKIATTGGGGGEEEMEEENDKKWKTEAR